MLVDEDGGQEEERRQSSAASLGHGGRVYVSRRWAAVAAEARSVAEEFFK
jgi:hypothetical protein